MLFSNPVKGTIRPSTWKRPAGSLDFRVTQPFGCTGYYAEGPYGSCPHFHRGIDLGNGRGGDPVMAAAPGTVTWAGFDGGNGVNIRHADGTITQYWHMASLAVRRGAILAAGAFLGPVGHTGNAQGDHLHWGWKTAAGVPMDPWSHLRQNVTVHPKGPGINIRTTATMGPVFAISKPDGSIETPAGVDLGATFAAYAWGGTVTGAAWNVNGVTGNTWERIYLAGAYRFIASGLAVLSAT